MDQSGSIRAAMSGRCMDGRADTLSPLPEWSQRRGGSRGDLGMRERGVSGCKSAACFACGRKNRAVSEVTRGARSPRSPGCVEVELVWRRKGREVTERAPPHPVPCVSPPRGEVGFLRRESGGGGSPREAGWVSVCGTGLGREDGAPQQCRTAWRSASAQELGRAATAAAAHAWTETCARMEARRRSADARERIGGSRRVVHVLRPG